MSVELGEESLESTATNVIDGIVLVTLESKNR